MKNNKKKMNTKAVIFLGFVFLFFTALACSVFLSALESGIVYTNTFWVGVVFWILVGIFMDEIQIFFKKRHFMWSIILVVSAAFYVNLAKSRIIPTLYEFGAPAGFYPLIWFIRGVYKEYMRS